MNRSEILEHLLVLESQHHADWDGGYGLVYSIKDWVHTLDGQNRVELRDVLLELVESSDARLWGVALETLTQDPSAESAHKLWELFERRPTSPQDWKDQVGLALMRLKYQPAADDLCNYLKTALLIDKRAEVLPIAAALSGIDPKRSIDLTSRYLGSELIKDPAGKKHRGFVPAFVRNFLPLDKGLLTTLVKQTAAVNPSSAEILIDLLNDYLNRPYVAREFGEDLTDSIRNELRLATP